MNDQSVAETSTLQHTTLTTDKHPWPGWDSNPRSQQASGRLHCTLQELSTCTPTLNLLEDCKILVIVYLQDQKQNLQEQELRFPVPRIQA